MALQFYGGQLLFSGGQLAMDPACCCDGTGCIEGLGVDMLGLEASLTVDFVSCTPIPPYEDCDLNDVTALAITGDSPPDVGTSWSGEQLGRGGQYLCNSGETRLTGLHRIAVSCVDDSTVRIAYQAGGGNLAVLDQPYSTFDPTATHVLTPQANIGCDINSVTVSWS